MIYNRMRPDARRAVVLAAALPVARLYGYAAITRDQVAAAARVSPAVLNYHFGRVEALRRAVLAYGIEQHDQTLIAQAVVADDPLVADLPDAVRRAALETLLA